MAQHDDGDFVALLTQHQSRLFAYILSLTGNAAQAEDILQEANVVLWEKRGTFESSTHFSAWMLKVAYLQVMAWRQKRARERIVFDNDTVSTVSARATERVERQEDRQHALRDCMEKLSPRHRDLIRRRYATGSPMEDIGKEVGLSSDAVKQAIFRARLALIECVKRATARSDGTQAEGGVA